MSTTITAHRIPGWDDKRDQVLSTVIIGIIKGSERAVEATAAFVSLQLHYFSSVLPCETVALCARSASTLMRKAGLLATAMVPLSLQSGGNYGTPRGG
jgi:hypothetical protein